MKIESRLTSLAEIVEKDPVWHFNIPIYQRLYVWGEDQVLTLLSDLVNAYERGADLFFLGGTLLVEQEGGAERCFDLIDGQQRFTTLWLLCHAWTRALEEKNLIGPLKSFITANSGDHVVPRLRFAIRPEVNRFLEGLAFGPSGRSDVGEEAVLRMRTAINLMDTVLVGRRLPDGVANREVHLAGLAEFIFTKVRFVITTVPRETDLNKLFEVINNRGVQLQHHEILKARMMDALSEGERGPYAVLWEACADMENFVERNLGGVSGLPMHELTGIYEDGQLPNADAIRTAVDVRLEGAENDRVMSLTEILKSEDDLTCPEDETGIEEEFPMWVRSIFGFPLFLQHTLRIWLLKQSRADLPRLLDRELLALFEEHFLKDEARRRDNVRSFIALLWKLRVIFDEHIIKWADQGEDEIHLISRISVSENKSGKRNMSRSTETDSHRGFSLLQSMLYHSQEITTQYWLTPLLLFIHDNPELKTSEYFAYLRHLDNHLLGSAVEQVLAVRTRSFMEDPWQRRDLVHQSELTQASGVKFARYWFYKLEFVLWFQEIRKSEHWRKFRLTAKSSVEHISPQTPMETDENQVKQALDHFGNLALVSRSLNSEYGNLPYNEKRQRFINNNKSRLDSLKMALIYENKQWNDERAFAHQQEMIELLDSYCESCADESSRPVLPKLGEAEHRISSSLPGLFLVNTNRTYQPAAEPYMLEHGVALATSPKWMVKINRISAGSRVLLYGNVEGVLAVGIATSELLDASLGDTPMRFVRLREFKKLKQPITPAEAKQVGNKDFIFRNTVMKITGAEGEVLWTEAISRT